MALPYTITAPHLPIMTINYLKEEEHAVIASCVSDVTSYEYYISNDFEYHNATTWSNYDSALVYTTPVDESTM